MDVVVVVGAGGVPDCHFRTGTTVVVINVIVVVVLHHQIRKHEQFHQGEAQPQPRPRFRRLHVSFGGTVNDGVGPSETVLFLRGAVIGVGGSAAATSSSSAAVMVMMLMIVQLPTTEQLLQCTHEHRLAVVANIVVHVPLIVAVHVLDLSVVGQQTVASRVPPIEELEETGGYQGCIQRPDDQGDEKENEKARGGALETDGLRKGHPRQEHNWSAMQRMGCSKRGDLMW
jgi:hypothetical protein